MNENVTASKARGSALIPFLVFIIVYLGAGIILDRLGVDMAFYQFPSPVAALIGIVVAFVMFKGSIDEKFTIFAKGCGHENILNVLYLFIRRCICHGCKSNGRRRRNSKSRIIGYSR